MIYLKTLWTIGHSTRGLREFLTLLRENGIELLADVRSFPGSRRYPHFNKENLSGSLREGNIDYLHMQDLGGRRKAAKDSGNTVWRHPAFRGYADYMETPEFKRSAEVLMQLAAAKRTCIMCSEAVWWRCHRSMIADYFKSREWTVLHILSATKVEEHPYTKAATITGGQLSYGEGK